MVVHGTEVAAAVPEGAGVGPKVMVVGTAVTIPGLPGM
jgi:hypothetical protein